MGLMGWVGQAWFRISQVLFRVQITHPLQMLVDVDKAKQQDGDQKATARDDEEKRGVSEPPLERSQQGRAPGEAHVGECHVEGELSGGHPLPAHRHQQGKKAIMISVSRRKKADT